jgi:branched-chain amino acid transport system permease protein
MASAERRRHERRIMSAYVTSVLAIVGINIMLAVSLNMISGFCGQFSLGHAAFYGAGAYAAGFCAAAGAPVPLALLSGIVVAGLLGLVVGFASLRLRHDFLAVTTIGVSFLFVGFVRKQSWLGAEMGISKIPPSGLGSEGNTLLILACALATVAFSLYVNRSWMGFGFRAVGDDEDTARTIGIPVSGYKLVAFTLGTAIAGLAGGLYAYFTQFIVPDSFGFIVSVTLMAMVVIGGTGSTLGVVAAAIVLTLLPEMFRFINEYRLLIFGGLLVLVMRFAPAGMAGIGRAVLEKVRGQ